MLRRLVSISLASAALLTATACSRSDDEATVPDAEVFCTTARQQPAFIISPPMATEAELQATMDFYRLMGELAPLAVTEDWAVLVEAMETASTIVPGDPESEQLVAMTAYATEPSAYRVKKWFQDHCGLDLPITTISPQEQVPARTTTTTTTATIATPGTQAPDD